MNNLENEKTILEEKLMQKMKQAKYYKAKYKETQQEIERLKEENNYYFKKNNELSTLNTSLREDRDKCKNIIKEAIDFVESMEYCGQEDYFYDLKAEDECGNDNTFNDSKHKLLEILDKGE